MFLCNIVFLQHQNLLSPPDISTAECQEKCSCFGSASSAIVIGLKTWITVILNGLPWKWTEIILSFLRLHPSTAFQTLLLTEGKKMAIGAYLAIITLNVNELNAPTKRHRLTEWIWKQDPYICCLQETHFRPKDTYKLKVRRWKNVFHAIGNQKKAGEAILISDKIDLKIKNIRRDKERHYIVIKGSI